MGEFDNDPFVGKIVETKCELCFTRRHINHNVYYPDKSRFLVVGIEDGDYLLKPLQNDRYGRNTDKCLLLCYQKCSAIEEEFIVVYEG